MKWLVRILKFCKKFFTPQTEGKNRCFHTITADYKIRGNAEMKIATSLSNIPSTYKPAVWVETSEISMFQISLAVVLPADIHITVYRIGPQEKFAKKFKKGQMAKKRLASQSSKRLRRPGRRVINARRRGYVEKLKNKPPCRAFRIERPSYIDRVCQKVDYRLV